MLLYRWFSSTHSRRPPMKLPPPWSIVLSPLKEAHNPSLRAYECGNPSCQSSSCSLLPLVLSCWDYKEFVRRMTGGRMLLLLAQSGPKAVMRPDLGRILYAALRLPGPGAQTLFCQMLSLLGKTLCKLCPKENNPQLERKDGLT